MFDLQIISHQLRVRVKSLDFCSRAEQKEILEKLAFDSYIRKGFVAPEITALQQLAVIALPGFKFNPYHDELGRFTFGPGGSGDDSEADDNANSGGGDNGTPDQDGAPIRLVQEVIPPDILFGEPPATIEAPLDEFPQDPAQSPGPGYEWRGDGPPGSGEGSWSNSTTRERLYPDMENEKHGPHWDYRAPDSKWWRWYPDGKMEPKIIVGGEIA